MLSYNNMNDINRLILVSLYAILCILLQQEHSF